MDLDDVTQGEGLSDASERHDIVMQLASEATDGEPNRRSLCTTVSWCATFPASCGHSVPATSGGPLLSFVHAPSCIQQTALAFYQHKT